MVNIPPVPDRDPVSALLDDPCLPEHKRFCPDPKKEHRQRFPVGRSRNGRPGLVDGFCTECRAQFSFRPKLAPGDLVHGQYKVSGCLGHGGVGWIHLGVDLNLDDNRVVLKGLLDSTDAEAQAATEAERHFLVEVDHPNIVRPYNFVKHPDPLTGADLSYLVMAYVPGQSLRQLRQERGPLPLEEVLGYALDVLAALHYLHGIGLAYCDLKPDNVIIGDRLTLIDLGAMRRLDDLDSPMWVTRGYQDPNVGKHRAFVAHDLYTAARTMAALSCEFPDPGFSSPEWEARLPDPDGMLLFRDQESYYRLLRRATNEKPSQRFKSAGAMAEQVFGVLREVLAAKHGEPRPWLSALFGPELRVLAVDDFPAPPKDLAAAALALPNPQMDAADRHARFLGTLNTASPEDVLGALSTISDPSVETRLRAVRARLELNQVAAAVADLDGLEAVEPGDWRLGWYRALSALAAGQLDDAEAAFDAALDAFPGEAAPKLALALCAELRGAYPRASHYYQTVWCTDHSYVSAAFGLARIRFAEGNRPGAAEALESVPEATRYGVAARLAALRARVLGRKEREPLEGVDFDAIERVNWPDLDAERRERAQNEVLEATLGWVRAGSPGKDGTTPTSVLKHPLTERGLRLGLERSYRTLAKMTDRATERVELVDEANSVRPRSWV